MAFVTRVFFLFKWWDGFPYSTLSKSLYSFPWSWKCCHLWNPPKVIPRFETPACKYILWQYRHSDFSKAQGSTRSWSHLMYRKFAWAEVNLVLNLGSFWSNFVFLGLFTHSGKGSFSPLVMETPHWRSMLCHRIGTWTLLMNFLICH